MANRYRVYIGGNSYKPEYAPKKLAYCENVGYHRVVLADSRVEALEKCLPDIRKELHKFPGKYVSVYVGKKHSVTGMASRLWPMQVVIETGERRQA